MTNDSGSHAASDSGGQSGAGGQGTSGETTGGERTTDSGTVGTEEAVFTDAATVHAYDDGRRLLDPTVIAGRDVHITVQTFMRGAQGFVGSPGRVPEEQLETLRQTYAAVEGYGDLVSHLRRQRLLILVGAESSGRSTTALHLLDEVSDGNVSRLEPGSDLTSRMGLASSRFDEHHGYVGELDVSDGEQMRVGTDRLAAELALRNAYCVLVARPSPTLRHVLGPYRAECSVVSPMKMLENHLHAGLSGDSDLDDDWVVDIVVRDDVAELIGHAALPAQVAEIATLLLRNGRSDIAPELRARIEQILFDERFEEWFAALGALRPGVGGRRIRQLTAIRIAVAVFDKMPRHIAVAAADDLAAHLESPHPPPRTSPDAAPPPAMRGPARLLDPDEARSLASSSAIRIEQRDVLDGSGVVPGEVIRYADDRIPVALLRWVWMTQYALREPIIAWLDGLSREPRGHVRLRAAQAAGLLCTVDFTHTVSNLVQPAAEARPGVASAFTVVDEQKADVDEEDQLDVAWSRHHFAAVAMDHAARDPALHQAVRGLLTRWRRSQQAALRWTSAIALGFDVGAREVDKTLDELRVLGTPGESDRFREIEQSDQDGRRRAFALRHENEVFNAAASGMVWLFRIGAHRQVLDALALWMLHPRRSVRWLALQSVIYMMKVRVAAVGRPEANDPQRSDDLVSDVDRTSRRNWPVLLALHTDDRQLGDRSAALVRDALRTRHRRPVLKVLADWIELAAEDDDALAAVEAALTRLVREETDRARLRGLVRHMQHRWEDPLADGVAQRIDAVLTEITIDPGEKVLA